MRIAALKELSETEVTCLISTDDEAFTYNKHVNRLSPVQEHKMILRAIERRVPEERLNLSYVDNRSWLSSWNPKKDVLL